MASDGVKRIYEDLVQKMADLESSYRMHKPIVEKIYDEAWAILAAKDTTEALALSEKVFKKAQDHCIFRWAKGDADGPLTPEWCERRADSYESFAAMKRKKGNIEAAEKDEAKARDFRKQADWLRKQS